MSTTSNRVKSVCITLRGPLNDDVRVIIRTVGEQIGKSCPRIVQFCLVVESINLNGIALFVLGDGDEPQVELVRCNVVEGGCLMHFDMALEVTNGVCGSGLDRKGSGRW